MSQNPLHDYSDELNNLINQFKALKAGRLTYLEEESFEILIDHFLENDFTEDAYLAAGFGLEQHAQSSRLMIKKADVLLVQSKHEEALYILNKSYLFDRSDPGYYILKTEALLGLDRQEEAAQLLETAIEFFEGDEKIELLFELTDVYDDYVDFDKVFDCLKIILEMQPTNEEALYRICFWTDMTGRNEEGIHLHQTIIDDFPYCSLAWFNLGSAFQGIKLYEKSIDAYQYAVAIDEKFDYAYRNMADAYIRLRKYKEAVESLLIVSELGRPESIILEAIGHCYDKMENPAQARFYYKKAHHVEPEDAMMLLKIATTYMNQSNWEQAIKYLEQALKKFPHQPEFNLAIGRCFLNLEQYEQAIQYLGVAVKVRPKNMGSWIELLNCFYKSELFEEGYNCAAVAFEQTHAKPIFVYYKAAFLMAMGMQKQGLLYLEAAMKANAKLVKKFTDIDATLLQNPAVVEIISRHKKNKQKPR